MIVAVVAEPTAEKVLERTEALARSWGSGGIFVELRLDAMDRPELDIIKRIPFQVIATCRPKKDGGLFEGGEDEREVLLSRAAAAGAAYIDLELDMVDSPTLPWDVRRILSYHDFEKVPADAELEAIVLEGFKGGADMVKIACRAENLGDLLRLRRAAAIQPGAVIVVGMGSAGLVSRVLYESMGSPWTYAHLGEEDVRRKLAPGLPELSELMELRGHQGRLVEKISKLFLITITLPKDQIFSLILVPVLSVLVGLLLLG